MNKKIRLDEMVAKQYIITTAQRGAVPHKRFLEGLEKLAKMNDGEVLIIPTNGMAPLSSKADDEEQLHPYITTNYRVIDGDFEFNNNIGIRNFPVQAQQIDPTTSLDRFVGYDQSAIFASPKQRMKVVPNSNTKMPKVLMSPGACTLPHYKDNRRGTIATLEHVVGAITLTLDTETGNYHYRQIRANKKGDFYDLQHKYSGSSKPKVERINTLVMGDYHAEEINKDVLAATEKMIKELKPRTLVLHDFFDGYSISHHDQGRYVLRAQKSAQLNLAQELYNCGRHLQNLKDIGPKDMQIVVVKSNHDEVIDRYLQEGRFLEDPQNMHLAAQILPHFIEKKDPLQKGIELTYGKIHGVKFLKRDDDFKRFGWQLANHGDLGANGSRGGHRSLENACSKAIYGHSHTPNIIRNMFHVGTSSELMLDYTRGPSSWMNTHAILYNSGQPTLVNIIDGRYR